MSTHPTAVPLPPSAFPSRPPSHAVPASHLPLPRAQYPLLHSLIDSPEYRQTVQKHPELFTPPPVKPPSSSSQWRQSTRRPPSTPASAIKAAWQRTNSTVKRRDRASQVSQMSAHRTISSRIQGGGGIDSVSSPPTATTSSRLRRDSSHPYPSNATALAPPDSAQFGPSRNNSRIFSTPSRPSADVSVPDERRSTSIRRVDAQKGAESQGTRNPSLPPTLSSVPSLRRDDRHSSSFRSLPALDTGRSARSHRSLPPTASYPVRIRPTYSDSNEPRMKTKPSSSFNEAIAQLKRMLHPPRTDSRSRRNSKSGRPSSDSLPDLSKRIEETERPRKVSSPLRLDEENETALTRIPRPLVNSPSTSLSPLTQSSRQHSLDHLPQPPPKRLLARAPLLSQSDLPNYLESRRQLFQLLREGPGADPARSSSVLQATIRSAHNEEDSSNWKAKFRWIGGGSRGGKGGEVESRGGMGGTSVVRKDSWRSRKKSLKSLKRQKSVSTLRSLKPWHRAQSVHEVKKPTTGRTSEDSLGFVHLATSTSLNFGGEPATYATYQRETLGGDAEEEEGKVWEQWKWWVKERRDHLQSNK
ncbi:uncharacterized protein JCM6883_006014 [Sporobolomyces salmoneus]|uniref:uncharacterized protein n=1 Tax=Sporobolomyces salmoneus TaxID=183962 RepID=UPI0031721ED5